MVNGTKIPINPQLLFRMKPDIKDVANYGNLLIAHANARKGKRKQFWVKKCDDNKEKYLKKLENILLSGTYHTSKYRNKIIMDMRKERLISRLPYFPDRIVHWAIIFQLEPLFIQSFSKRCHAAIPGRGIHTALKQVRETTLKRRDLKYCLKIDIRHYFQNVDHDTLKEKLAGLVDDKELLSLMYEIVDSYPEGIPIGNYTSQYFANFYLNSFDEYIESLGLIHVRYMDDVVMFGESSEILHKTVHEIEHYLNLYLHLSLKSNWQIFPIRKRGIDFVGYRVYPDRVLLRKTTFRSLRRKMTNVYKRVSEGRWSEHDRCVVASYAGWCRYCTPKVRRTIYFKYFSPILNKLPAGNEKYEKNIRRLLL